MTKIKQNDPIKNVMTTNPETVSISDKLSKPFQILKEGKYHHLPVVSGNKLVGMISHTDIMRIDYSDSFGQDSREVMATLDASKSIEEVMTKNLVTLKETDTVKEASKKLCVGDFHSLPVVSDDGEIKGLVTSTDLIKYFAEIY